MGRWLSHLGHLARRFVRSLSSAPPSPEDEAWALGFLLPGEQDVWRRLTNPDRRHAIEVARRFAAASPSASRAEMAAALLHDCGKVASGLGTWSRVAATVWIGVVGRERASRGDGRVARYARHEELGADLLAAAGSDPVTVALVRGDAASPALSALRHADDL